ncbi:glycosyltransferase family 2 protein [Pseudomonas juntendi]|uniref:Glycosyltransferase n=1 Tax=Pseudomonas juntendi TaxID=2666183 RepID=A0A7W2JIG9_9PSED|nr:glycosyltransferase [Pseudomonas juntendi]MBA6059597.1 glycosyltransferase [Pseudomonas juntendi]MBA6125879.1 glycosyltransferase [Pseudomonas juntendi]
MNAIAYGLRSDVTVVLLGHEQAEYRNRALYYYQQVNVPCLALAPLRSNDEGQACSDRLQQAIAQISTPLVVLALDADFVLPDALDNAAACLSETPDCIGAQGYALAYATGSAQTSYYKASGHLAGAGQGAIGRLQEYASAGQQAWRAVVRVPALQAAIASLPAGLDFVGWRQALSYALLTQGAFVPLPQTDVVCNYAPCTLTMAAREQCLTGIVRAMRNWEGAALCEGEAGFALLNEFVRNTYTPVQLPLLFTSSWLYVSEAPERVFESRQFVEMPYYSAALFSSLTELEFLCHAWPAGQRQYRALEGVWVRQRELLKVYPNDTAESLQVRYWEALSLGIFNQEVCHRLVASLSNEGDAIRSAELRDWLLRLDQVPSLDAQSGLALTPSGRMLSALAAATPDYDARERVLAHLAQSTAGQIAFVVLDLNNDDAGLQVTFDSLLASGLRNFKLLVLKAGKPPVVTTPRDTLHFIAVTEGNWVAHLNQALYQLPSDWLLLLHAGEQLLSGGLLQMSVELSKEPACQAICANEVQKDAEGRLQGIQRPSADLDLLRGQPALMSRHWLLRRQAVLDLNGFSEAVPGAVEFELLLRLVETKGVGSLAHLDDYLVLGEQSTEALSSQAQGVLERHLRQLGYQGHVSETDAGLQIDLRHPATPMVSILLASEGELASVQPTLTSILQRTRYPRFEVVLACAAQAGDDQVSERQGMGARVRLLTADVGASRNELLNLAASHAKGEYLVILSERAEVISPAWLEGLLNEAQRPEVGIVGAALHDADTGLVHGGYDLLVGPQVHPLEHSGEGLWSQSVRGREAVSSDCLMLSKAQFSLSGGLELVPGADIHLCLVAGESGLMVLWTPRAQVRVATMPSVDQQAAQILAERWPHKFCGQPREAEVSSAQGPAWLSAF